MLLLVAVLLRKEDLVGTGLLLRLPSCYSADEEDVDGDGSTAQAVDARKARDTEDDFVGMCLLLRLPMHDTAGEVLRAVFLSNESIIFIYSGHC